MGHLGPAGRAGDPIWGGSGRYVDHLGVIWGLQGVQGTLSGADLDARGPYLGGSARYVGHLGGIWAFQGVLGTLSGADLGSM